MQILKNDARKSFNALLISNIFPIVILSIPLYLCTHSLIDSIMLWFYGIICLLIWAPAIILPCLTFKVITEKYGDRSIFIFSFIATVAIILMIVLSCGLQH